MAESNDVKAIEKISSDLDESKIYVIFSSESIKAKKHLLNKIRKRIEHLKTTCRSIYRANVKFVAEIKQPEQENNSLEIAQKTMELGNIQQRKELLLAKEIKQDKIDRVTSGENKYEDMWLQATNRFKSLPYVQLLFKNIEKTKELESGLVLLEIEAETIFKDIEEKKKHCLEIDRKRIIELAEYIAHEMPNTIKIINERSTAIYEKSKEIDELIKERETNSSNKCLKTLPLDKEPASEGTKKSLACDYEKLDITLMPKMQIVNKDLDDISVRLDQIKKDVNNDMFDTITYPDKSDNNSGKEKNIDYNASCLNRDLFEENKTQNFSNRKLINILENIKVDKNEVINIVSKVNPEKLQTVTTISIDENHIHGTSKQCKTKINEPMESDEIEEIDLTSSNNIIFPPTQFLDAPMERKWGDETQDEIMQVTKKPEKYRQILREETMKKKVSFDLPPTQSFEASNRVEENVSVCNISQLDVSAASEDSFVKIKDMLIKKHNLDLSPQFVYAKNNLIQARNNDKIVLSKFFDQKNQINSQNVNIVEQMDEEMAVEPENNGKEIDNQPSVFQIEGKPNDEGLVHMDVDEMIISSPKKEVHTNDKPADGLLFMHRAQAISDSLNVSMSTTGYEDADTEFPHCIDSSLLLSPKADMGMPMNFENAEILSQEGPNFLRGLRKTGLSFFGQMNSSESKPDSGAQNKGNSFNFNFGGSEDKKDRCGLFNMFN